MAAQLQLKFQQALSWQQQGLLSQAQFIYEEILRVHPGNTDALGLLAVIAAQTNNLQRAVALFDRTIEIKPNDANLYFNRGLALHQLQQLDAAVASYDQAIDIKPDYAGAYLNRGNALSDLRQSGAAVDSYSKAIAIEPGFAPAYNNRGLALLELQQLDAALADFDQAIAIGQNYAEAYFNRGITLHKLKHFAAALANYDQAIAIKPEYTEAYNNRGITLQELNQLDAAIASYDRAITLTPDHAEAYNNRGLVLYKLKQPEAALANFDRAIAIKPSYAEAHFNRGNSLYKLKQHQAAIESYDMALAIKSDYDFLYGVRLHLKMHICDWHDAEAQLAVLIQKIQGNEKASPPFPVLALTPDITLQRKAAEIFAQDQYPANLELGIIPKRHKGTKIRLGYFSMDFRNHAVSFLTAGLFETHDRDKFELIAFAFGSNAQDEMRQRLEVAFDRFIDVSNESDQTIAELARRLEIDIAIDLGGFTADFRTGIFAFRAAPLQVNFLGYPGSMGAKYMDYLIADQQVIPAEAKSLYSEKIVHLPCFQPNDRQRKISAKAFTRAELHLPYSGFVFCSLNNNYKITPNTFTGWMRILSRVDGSVLFLLEDNPTAADNLRKEATLRGVDAARLVFAKRLPTSEYLARYRYADLFLDTFPFNGGTTVSDALWAGLPVLTLPGEAFASRMATSLLTAIEVPELVAKTQEEYENLAVELATNPEQLNAIKRKLERNRLTTPLFDTRMFTRNIENAYTQMHERERAGLPPDHIYV